MKVRLYYPLIVSIAINAEKTLKLEGKIQPEIESV